MSLHSFIDYKKLSARIKELQKELTTLLDLERSLGKSISAQRGRKPGKAAKATGKRGKRGKVKKTVLAYLEKHKEAKASEIAKSSGLKIGSINQVLFALKRNGTVTQDKKRGSPFVLAKK